MIFIIQSGGNFLAFSSSYRNAPLSFPLKKLDIILKQILFSGLKYMIKECNFKSKIIHREKPGCNLTPNENVCSGEDNCIIYQVYKNLETKNKK